MAQDADDEAVVEHPEIRDVAGALLNQVFAEDVWVSTIWLASKLPAGTSTFSLPEEPDFDGVVDEGFAGVIPVADPELFGLTRFFGAEPAQQDIGGAVGIGP